MVTLTEPTAIGLKMMKMALKDSWMPVKTSWYQRRSKADRQVKEKGDEKAREKEKAEEEEDSSDQGKKKADEKEERKAALT